MQPIGARRVYDLRVEPTHTFFANGVAVSNCLIRAFDKMMCAEVGRQPAVGQLLLALIKNALLGTQDRESTERPHWRARMLVHRSFHWDRLQWQTWCNVCHPDTNAHCPHCDRVPTARTTAHREHLCDMCAFLRANRFLAFFGVKEFYASMIDASGVVRAMLERSSTWVEHMRVLRNGMDDARRTLSLTVARGTEPVSLEKAMQACARSLSLLHDCVPEDHEILTERGFMNLDRNDRRDLRLERRGLARRHRELRCANAQGASFDPCAVGTHEPMGRP